MYSILLASAVFAGGQSTGYNPAQYAANGCSGPACNGTNCSGRSIFSGFSFGCNGSRPTCNGTTCNGTTCNGTRTCNGGGHSFFPTFGGHSRGCNGTTTCRGPVPVPVPAPVYGCYGTRTTGSVNGNGGSNEFGSMGTW